MDGASAHGSVIRYLSLYAALISLLANPARAAQWDVVPAFSVQGTYTDNLSLSPDTLARSDWITQLIPEISVTAAGTGLAFSLNYAPELTYYAQNEGDNQVFQRGNLAGVTEIADDLLFLDVGANVDQYNVFLQGPITDSNVNTTGNLATVGTFFASPYLSHNFGAKAQVQARFTYSIVDSSDSPEFNNTADRIDLDMTSGSDYRLLSWKLAYTKAAIDYESRPDLDADVTLADARQLITATIGILAQVGYENYQRVVLGEAFGERIGGSRWGVGFEWAPSPRSRFAMIIGDRFFGDTYYLNLSHRARLITFSASYNEDVTTARTEFFAPDSSNSAGYLDPLYCAERPDLEECSREVKSIVSKRGLPANLNQSVNFFSEQPFLLKRAEASAAMVGTRNIIIGNLFSESRELLPGSLLPTGSFAESSKIDQTGTGVTWNLLVTPRDTLNLEARYSRNEFRDTARVDDITLLRTGFRKQFQPRLSGSLEYRRQQTSSIKSTNDFTENAVLATLRMEF